MKTLSLTTSLLLFSSLLIAQADWNTMGNSPAAGSFIGTNNNQPLNFRTNYTHHLQLLHNNTTTINGFTVQRDGFVGLSQTPGFFTGAPGGAFSLLHLNGDNGGTGAQQNGYRGWMKYGIIFTHNRDMMFVGPKANEMDETDAVIAWSDNWGDDVGPDVLRFIFLSGDGTGTGDSDADGLEVARMTGTGLTGVGINWSNSNMPKRTLDVVRNDGEPQFRISQTSTAQTHIGVFADMEVSPLGNLHVYPTFYERPRTVAIGFLPGMQTDPINTPFSTALDVGGITRIRKLLTETPNCLITGYMADGNSQDNFLGRLDFPNDTNLFPDGTGNWSSVDATGLDCRWFDTPSITVAGQTDRYKWDWILTGKAV